MSRTDIQHIFWNSTFIANLSAILVFWLASSGPLLASPAAGDVLIALGRVSGLLLMYFILVQLVLISRAMSLEPPFGFDKLNKLHRTLGFSLLALIVLHPLLLSIGYGERFGAGVFEQFISFTQIWPDVLAATIAAGIVLITGVLSIQRVRSFLGYDLWYFFHLFLYIAVVLSLGHQVRSGDVATGSAFFYWYALNATVFGLVIAYRFIKPAYRLWRHRFMIERIVKESESSFSIYITGRHMNAFRFEAGQFAHFIFFQKNKWQHHPFSFSAPFDGKTIRITVKKLGDFTTTADELKKGIYVWIDGPLGRLTLSSAATGKYCLIAGGAGITPIAALARSLEEPKETFLFIANRNKADAPLLEELRGSGVDLHPYFSDEGDKKIDAEEVSRVCPDVFERDVFLCGPLLMMTSIANGLEEKGLPRAQIHYEVFGY